MLSCRTCGSVFLTSDLSVDFVLGFARWGLDWAKMALACVKGDDPNKLRVCFEKLTADEINTAVSKGLVGKRKRDQRLCCQARVLSVKQGARLSF